MRLAPTWSSPTLPKLRAKENFFVVLYVLMRGLLQLERTGTCSLTGLID
jgi:hypothetical protein